MGALLRVELIRAFGSKTFMVSLAIGTAISILAAATEITGFWQLFSRTAPNLDHVYESQFANGAYTLWLPMSVSESLPNLFFFIAPLTISFAYAWSFRSDIQTGYGQSIIGRADRMHYYLAKSVAAFLSGGLVITIPLLINFLILICAVPCYQPDVSDVVYTGIWTKVFLSRVFYNCPLGYVMIKIVMDFLLAGLWSTAVLAMSIFIQSRVAIVALPYIVLNIIKYVSERVYMLTGVRWDSLTLLDHLKARGDAFYYSGWAVLADVALLLAISLVIPAITKRRDVL